MSTQSSGFLAPPLLVLADEHEERVSDAIAQLPGCAERPGRLLGAARVLLSQVPIAGMGERPLSAGEVRKARQAVALAMLAVKMSDL